MAYQYFIYLTGKKIRGLINNYFGFNKQQRRGLLVLCLICFTLLIVRLTFPYFISPADIVAKNLSLIAQDTVSGNGRPAPPMNQPLRAGKLFPFNPNTASREDLSKLGIPPKTISTLLKFRNKGFVFRKKEDLKKVYGFGDEIYQRLEAYVLLENITKPVKQTINEKKEPVAIDLNKADSSALVALRGIGPAFSKRIIKYRDLLGGFTRLEQLMEVYGFTSEMYDLVAPQLIVNDPILKKININSDDFKTLNRHPYLGYEITKAIFNHRKKQVLTEAALKEIINNDDTFKKLLPYASF